LRTAWVPRFRDRRMRKTSSPGDALDLETGVDPGQGLEIGVEKEEDPEVERGRDPGIEVERERNLEIGVEKERDLEKEDLVLVVIEDQDLKRDREKEDLKRETRNRMETVSLGESLLRVLLRKSQKIRKKRMETMKKKLRLTENVLQMR